MRKIGMMLVALFLTVTLVGCGESAPPAKPTGDTAKTTGTGTGTGTGAAAPATGTGTGTAK
jgi:hypothetical protein